MLQPKEKVIDLVNGLLDLLRSGEDLGESEFTIYRDIKSLNQEHCLTDLSYALFYHCKKDNVKADMYFNRSIRSNDFNCVGNYLSFLLKTGEIKKAIKAKNRFKQLLLDNLNSNIMDILLMTSSFEGDYDMFEYCLIEAEKRDIGHPSRDIYMGQLMSTYQAFKNKAGLTTQQVKLLLDIIVDVFEGSDLSQARFIGYESDEEHNINALVMYVKTDSAKALVNANFLLARAVAKEDQFTGKKFVPMFNVADMDKEIEGSYVC